MYTWKTKQMFQRKMHVFSKVTEILFVTFLKWLTLHVRRVSITEAYGTLYILEHSQTHPCVPKVNCSGPRLLAHNGRINSLN